MLDSLSNPILPFGSVHTEATHQDFGWALSVELGHRHIPLPDKMRNGGVLQKGAELRGVLWGCSRLQTEDESHVTRHK